MTLRVYAHGGYPSYEACGTQWDNDDHRAHQLVQALKGNEFNGFAKFKRSNGQQVRIDKQNKQNAFVIFGEWAVKLLNDMGLNDVLIVPVPSSSCLHIGGDQKGDALGRSITDRLPSAKISHRLHWGAQLQKSSEGGPRDYETLYSNIRVIPQRPLKEIILVDDVVTGGGHLKACAQALRFYGATVNHALCAGYTVHDRPEGGIFKVPAFDLNIP